MFLRDSVSDGHVFGTVIVFTDRRMGQPIAMMVLRIKMKGIDILLSSSGCIEFDALEINPSNGAESIRRWVLRSGNIYQ